MVLRSTTWEKLLKLRILIFCQKRFCGDKKKLSVMALAVLRRKLGLMSSKNLPNQPSVMSNLMQKEDKSNQCLCLRMPFSWEESTTSITVIFSHHLSANTGSLTGVVKTLTQVLVDLTFSMQIKKMQRWDPLISSRETQDFKMNPWDKKS